MKQRTSGWQPPDKSNTTKWADTVNWYQPTPEPSSRALDDFQVPVTASLIDIGGGASSLFDNLLGRDWSDITLLDIAALALEVAKMRLRRAAERVRWLVADMTAWLPKRAYGVWHD